MLCIWIGDVDFGLDQEGLVVELTNRDGTEAATLSGDELVCEGNRGGTNEDLATLDLEAKIGKAAARQALDAGVHVPLRSPRSQTGWASNEVLVQ